MMDKFSIYESIHYAASMYRRHLFLSVAVGATLGFASWAGVVVPRAVAQALGVHQTLIVVHQQTNHVHKNDTLIIKMHSLAKTAGSAFAKRALEYTKNTPSFYLVLIFFSWASTWLLTVYMYVGFLLFLFAIQKNKSSYGILFAGMPYFARYLCASFLYGFFVLSLGIGFFSVSFGLWSFIYSLLWNFLSHDVLRTIVQQLVVLLLVTGSLVAFIAYTIRYLFYGYCLVDKNCTVFESFSCSRALTQGSRLRLVPLFFVMLGFLYLYTHLIGLFTGYSGFHHAVDLNLWSFIHNILKGLALPFGGYVLVDVYRKLAA